MILKKFTIHTQDSIAVARDKLIQQVCANPWLGMNGMFLCGEVGEDFFVLRRYQGNGHLSLVRSITAINGWFESIPSGTVFYFTVEVNSFSIIASILFILQAIVIGWQAMINRIDGIPFVCALMILIPSIIAPYSIQDEMRFYRNKLNQVLHTSR
jgi:hypothetical protein